ncbi:MAG: pyrroline-5-carboxylate reductase [Candidatus Omnitrophica bacterium]|nr:pyrroline-5-carboxylate reductase [Candidatus Omnitrophota bacterium]
MKRMEALTTFNIMKTKIGFIGCGNMGQAILKGVVKDSSILVAEKDASRVALLKKKYKVACADVPTVVKKSNIIILAVKPQDFGQILDEIKGSLTKNHLVISIAAGITCSYIEERLGDVRVVRTMPNLPAQVGVGMTALCKGKFAKDNDVKQSQRIFDAIGKTVIVDEKWMNAVTAVSGSGPAYVFLFVECMMNAAKALGFPDDVSKDLVYQTLKGSVKLLEESSDGAETLRLKVTSKGGTTEAAIKEFFGAKLDEIFKTALKAAETRARELAK